jgi:hypothetical protein
VRPHLRTLGLTGRVAPAAAWTGLALSVVAFALTAVMIARLPEIAYTGSSLSDVALSTSFLITAALGAIVTQRHPRLPIGWIFSGIGVPMVVTLALVRYGMNALALGQVPELWILWVMQWLWIPSISLMATALPLLFPNGAPPSARWRPVALAIPVVIVILLFGYALRPGPLQPPFDATENPLWPGTPLPSWYTLALGLLQIPITIACFGGLVSRFRRSHGVERQQLKWFLFGLAPASLFLVSATLAEIVVGYDQARGVSGVFAGLALAAPAVTAGIGILRYRLFDIDVLIKRTLVYGAVSAVLVTTYAAAVVLLQTALRPFTAGSDLAVAASTLLVVALFQPIRRRIQDVVDRRFYRSRYDASRAIEAFAARLRNEVDLVSVRSDLVDVVDETLRPAHASVWLRDRA